MHSTGPPTSEKVTWVVPSAVPRYPSTSSIRVADSETVAGAASVRCVPVNRTATRSLRTVNGSLSDEAVYAPSPLNVVETVPVPVGPSSSIEVDAKPVAAVVADAPSAPMAKATVRPGTGVPLSASSSVALTAAGSEYWPEPAPVYTIVVARLVTVTVKLVWLDAAPLSVTFTVTVCTPTWDAVGSQLNVPAGVTLAQLGPVTRE